MAMDNKCLICEEESKLSLVKDGFFIYRCNRCNLFFVYPQPSSSQLKEGVYSGTYQSNKKKDLSNVELDNSKRKIFLYVKDNINFSGKILDVGCSNGEFLFYLKNNNYDCYGVEINSRTANIAKSNGLNVLNCFLEEAKYSGNYFDLIFLGDVIEHVDNPLSLIVECKRILKSTGLIIISTPNMNCFWSKSTFFLYRLFKVPWSSATPPHHLFQFSNDNLKKMMSDSGFLLVEGWYNRPPRFKYEIGQTHIWGNYKREKNVKNLLLLIFGLFFYTVLYLIDIIITPLKDKDFGMVNVYKLNK